MKVKLNQKVFEITDSDGILSEISSIEGKGDHQTISELADVFVNTLDPRVWDTIALIFADSSDKRVVPILIEKIIKFKYSAHISTLIYACSEYDCAEWIVFFVRLIIEFENQAEYDALRVIEEIKSPVSLSDKIICVKLLSDCLVVLDKRAEKYKLIKNAVELIESMSTHLDSH